MRVLNTKILFLGLVGILSFNLFARTHELKSADGTILFLEDNFLVPPNWHHRDYDEDLILGISSELAYQNHPELMQGEEIIVAVIDSGIDVNHEDLQGKIWINQEEIPNNGYDDDHNGYVDDVMGWNFLGNAKGSGEFNYSSAGQITSFTPGAPEYQLKADTLSLTRKLIYLQNLADAERTEGQNKELKSLTQNIKRKLERAKKLFDEFSMDEDIFLRALNVLQDKGLTKENVSLDELENISGPLTQTELQALSTLKGFLSRGTDLVYLTSQKEMYQTQYEVHYNMNSTIRFDIVQDDPSKIFEQGYGNNDIIGPNPTHGTHVAGIIAANRDNNFGIKGLAPNIKIMPLRAIPNGDERDKDVISAIYYAIENGAKVINLSFGKYFSEHSDKVQKALQYAKAQNVLVVQAAGNDYLSLDEKPNFPSPVINGKTLSNYITVGSTTPYLDETLMSPFSNFGKMSVDLLAPGSFIYSTIPNNKFASMSGTSMAAPMVTSIAAALLSQASTLAPEKVKKLLIGGMTKLDDHLIRKPGLAEVALSEVVKHPGIVNLYKSYQLFLDSLSNMRVQ